MALPKNPYKIMNRIIREDSAILSGLNGGSKKVNHNMRQYPTMTFRKYILKFALQTRDGEFFCSICNLWINKQRWIHFKKEHRYAKT